MKILIATHYFLPHKGGIEFVAYNQAKELVKKGHQVTIVSSKIGNEPEEEIMDGIKVRRVKAWNYFEDKQGVPYPIYSPKIFSVTNLCSSFKSSSEISESFLFPMKSITFL